MGEKNKKNNEEQQKEGAENKKKENGGGKDGVVTVILKADLHCQGCITKVLKCIRSLNGVNTADIGGEQKITVVGRVDPVKLREKVEQKTHKRIELVSPQSKKDSNNNKNGDNKENAKGKDSIEGDNGKQEEKKKKESNEKKSKEKEPPVTTAVLKMHLHCEGCIQKICKTVAKTKGYQDIKVDRQKDLVTVTGAMDMKALAEMLKKHLKKDVEILPPKKEVEKKESAGVEKGKSGCDKAKSGGDKGKGSGDKGKSGGSSGGGGGDGGETAGGSEKMEGHRMQFQVAYPYPYPYPHPLMYGQGAAVDQFYYNPYVYGPYHAPQLFSDENPNACSIM
ncbi:Copper chaperone [Handroanthus impetiginosus]|uniref:Copper chaperone n=1 Tax=Handroanthus impetiginosus TaxID=429701 RepID=A0A2G9GWC9_9LAMI|nr:Copper chaperone [Handroanthus impetiginosus]